MIESRYHALERMAQEAAGDPAKESELFDWIVRWIGSYGWTVTLSVLSRARCMTAYAKLYELQLEEFDQNPPECDQ